MKKALIWVTLSALVIVVLLILVWYVSQDRSVHWQNELSIAAAAGDVPRLNLALSKGAEPNYEFPGGGTVLHTAIVNKNEECIRILLEHGADKSIKDKNGKTAGAFIKYYKVGGY